MEEALRGMLAHPPKGWLNASQRVGVRTSHRLWTVKEHHIVYQALARALKNQSRFTTKQMVTEVVPAVLNVAPSDVLEYLLALGFPVRTVQLNIDETVGKKLKAKRLNKVGYKRKRSPEEPVEEDDQGASSDDSIVSDGLVAIFRRPRSDSAAVSVHSTDSRPEPSGSALSMLRGPSKK